MHSIRVKITAVTIAAILTSILALGGIGILTIGLESDRSSVEKMSLISENMQMRLDAYLDSLKQSVDMAIHMADDSLMDLDYMVLGSSQTPEQKMELDAILKEHCAEVEHAFRSIANNTSGITTYFYCINSDLGSSEHGFFWSKLGSETFIEQPPLNSTELDINDIEHTTWYYSPLKAGRPVWIGPYPAHYLNEMLTISYVAPIYRYGFLIGVLGMDILFDTIIEQVNDLKVYDSGFVFLMDKNGRILYHPERELGSEPVDVLFHTPTTEVFKRRSSGDSLIRYQINGEERQLAFSTLSNNMKVAVMAPVSEINASQRQMTLIFLLVAVMILAIFAVVTLLLMDALTKPLLRLTAASQKLADGDYDVDLDYKGDDEVGILTRSFSRMRDHLRLYISDLNSRAYTDALTGVKNKGAFNLSVVRLNDEIRHSENGKKPEFAFIIFDCNRLKQINDENGHTRGDIYIQNACKLICRIFGEENVFRMGGDEFSVILQKENYQNRERLLRSFDQEVTEYNAGVDSPWEKVDLSKGMAVFCADSDSSAEQTLQRADAQMYVDKRKNKTSHT